MKPRLPGDRPSSATASRGRGTSPLISGAQRVAPLDCHMNWSLTDLELSNRLGVVQHHVKVLPTLGAGGPRSERARREAGGGTDCDQLRMEAPVISSGERQPRTRKGGQLRTVRQRETRNFEDSVSDPGVKD
eukprot:568677-Rhodomonas_salina.2